MSEPLDTMKRAERWLKDFDKRTGYNVDEGIFADVLRELLARLAQLEAENQRLQKDNDELRRGIRSGFLDRAETAEARVQALEAALRTLIKKWRETADTWESQLDRGCYAPAKWPSGKGNIQNWINWLRSHANDLDQALAGTEQT